VLRIHVEHYSRHRPHRALELEPPAPTSDPTIVSEAGPSRVHRRALLGGLVHEYHKLHERISAPYALATAVIDGHERRSETHGWAKSPASCCGEPPVDEHTADDRVNTFMHGARRNPVIAALIIGGIVIAWVGGVTHVLTGDSIVGAGQQGSQLSIYDLSRNHRDNGHLLRRTSIMKPSSVWLLVSISQGAEPKRPRQRGQQRLRRLRDDGKVVKMAAWEHYAVLKPTLEEWVAQATSHIPGRPARIMRNVESGLHLWRFSGDLTMPARPGSGFLGGASSTSTPTSDTNPHYRRETHDSDRRPPDRHRMQGAVGTVPRI
jgi:hypothetical protein